MKYWVKYRAAEKQDYQLKCDVCNFKCVYPQNDFIWFLSTFDFKSIMFIWQHWFKEDQLKIDKLSQWSVISGISAILSYNVFFLSSDHLKPMNQKRSGLKSSASYVAEWCGLQSKAASLMQLETSFW